MNRKIVQEVIICGAIAFWGFLNAPVLLADDHTSHIQGGGGHHAQAEKVVIPDDIQGIWGAIHEKHEHLIETVQNKKLADVHQIAFAIRDLAKALPDKVSSDKKPRVEGAVQNIAKIAEALDRTGDAGDQKGTEANLRRLEGILKTLEAQVKSS
jgi:hypothetical protein